MSLRLSWQRLGEDVLVAVGDVVHRKRPGTLCLTGERLVWMMPPADPLVSVPYRHITSRLKGTGEKCSIKIVTKTDDATDLSYLFYFEGKENAAASREQILAKLAEMCSNATIGKDKQVYQHILETNPKIAQLHRELVLSGTITNQDFWATRQSLVRSEAVKLSQAKGLSNAIDYKIRAEELPRGDNAVDYVIRITPQEIHSIFLHFPEVHEAYQKNVPDKVSEKEFWNRYFVLKNEQLYVNDKAKLLEAKELFQRSDSEYYATGIEQRKMRHKEDVSNPLLDLTVSEEDHAKGYGNVDRTMVPTASSSTSMQRSSATKVIDIYNHHAEVVLWPEEASKQNGVEKPRPNVSAAKASSEKRTEKEAPADPQVVDGLIDESIRLEDLERVPLQPPVPLELRDTSRYFANQLLSTTGDGGGDVSKKSARNKYGRIRSSLSSWVPRLDKKTSVRRHQESRQFPFSDMFDSDRQTNAKLHMDETLLSLFHRSNELLRHFWCNLDNAPKLARMMKALEGVSHQLLQCKIGFEQQIHANASANNGSSELPEESRQFSLRTIENVMLAIQKATTQYRRLQAVHTSSTGTSS